VVFFPSGFPNENDKTQYIAILAAVGRVTEAEQALQWRNLLFDCWPLKMWPTGCPEMSVRNHQYSLCNSPQKAQFWRTSADLRAMKDLLKLCSIILQPWNRQQNDPSKRYYPATKRHDFITRQHKWDLRLIQRMWRRAVWYKWRVRGFLLPPTPSKPNDVLFVQYWQ